MFRGNLDEKSTFGGTAVQLNKKKIRAMVKRHVYLSASFNFVVRCHALKLAAICFTPSNIPMGQYLVPYCFRSRNFILVISCYYYYGESLSWASCGDQRFLVAGGDARFGINSTLCHEMFRIPLSLLSLGVG